MRCHSCMLRKFFAVGVCYLNIEDWSFYKYTCISYVWGKTVKRIVHPLYDIPTFSNLHFSRSHLVSPITRKNLARLKFLLRPLFRPHRRIPPSILVAPATLRSKGTSRPMLLSHQLWTSPLGVTFRCDLTGATDMDPSQSFRGRSSLPFLSPNSAVTVAATAPGLNRWGLSCPDSIARQGRSATGVDWGCSLRENSCSH